jgi:hypothetical protein
MKKSLLILLMVFIVKAGLGQNYNPAVNSGTISPAPLVTGFGTIQFIVGNTGNDPLNNLAQPMVLIITLSYGVPNNVNPIAAISGTYASKFVWLYDIATATYQGTQNQVIPAFGLGTIQITYRATLPSVPLNPQNGFNVNVIPPAYTNASNASGDDNVSSYTYGPAGTPLPVQLLTFTATLDNCTTVVNWQSANESNFSLYVVEYSKNGVDFDNISSVSGRGDNAAYSIRHGADQGKAYYRLKMIDIDGKMEYSRIIALDIRCGKSVVSVYPNPANDILNVNISGSDEKGATGSLFNMTGQVVLNKKMQNGTNVIDISRLSNGVYLLKLVDNTGTQTFKIVVE